jgi:micrococcal nuclease
VSWSEIDSQRISPGGILGRATGDDENASRQRFDARIKPSPLDYDKRMSVSQILGVTALVTAALPIAVLAQTVTKVPSGDAVVVSGVGKIRLLGIRSADEPATRFGQGTVPPAQPRRDARTAPTPAISGAISLKREPPSRTFLQQLVLGRVVRLQYDTLAGATDAPRAYVFLQDGTLVNAEMLRTGKARLDISRPFAHQEEFKRLEDEARTAALGIWAHLIGRP